MTDSWDELSELYQLQVVKELKGMILKSGVDLVIRDVFLLFQGSYILIKINKKEALYDFNGRIIVRTILMFVNVSTNWLSKGLLQKKS